MILAPSAQLTRLAGIAVALISATWGMECSSADFPTEEYANPLEQQMIEAAYQGNLEAVKSAISKGARPNARYGKKPSMFKRANGGAPAWARGWTALMAAIEGDRFDVVKYLLSAGATANIYDGRGDTPLSLIADKIVHRKEHDDIAGLLIRAGADVDAKTTFAVNGPTQETALHRAVGWGHTTIVQLLLDAGADPGARTSTGMAPVDYITRGRNDEGIRRLLSKAIEKQRKEPK